MSTVDLSLLDLVVFDPVSGVSAASCHVGSLGVMSSVVRQVASLAPMTQVFRVAIFWCVIEMADREYHQRSGHRMWLAIARATVRVARRAFASIAAALSNLFDDIAPVRRVAVFVFRFDRHR